MKQNLNKVLPGVKRDVLLSSWTTFAIGGKTDWFYQLKNTEKLVEIIKLCLEQKIPYFILGSGSNVLFSDDGFRGLVIKIDTRSYEINGQRIIAQAGVPLGDLVKLAYENSLSGLEFATGIPGSVGGAVIGNSGAAGKSIGQIIEEVKVLDKNGRIKELKVSDCGFDYRSSRFKKDKQIVLEIVLRFKKDKKEKIKREMDRVLSLRANRPKEKSAGSIFKNPLPKYAGQLIEACGLKGKKIGEAQVSQKHANYIVNLGKAKDGDVLKLITLLKQRVKEKFNIDLNLEVVLVKSHG